MPVGSLVTVWAMLICVNAIHAHHIEPAWVFDYFLPPVGTFNALRFVATQGRMLKSFFVVGTFSIALVGSGLVVRSWLRAPMSRNLTGWAEQLVLGHLLTGGMVLGLAFAGLIYPSTLLVLSLGLLLACPSNVNSTRQSIRSAVAGMSFRLPIAIPAGITILGVLMATAAPETATDALRFHLEIPRRLLLLHRLIPQEEFPFAWLPMLPQCMSLVPFWIVGTMAVRQLGWVHYVLIGLVVGEQVRAVTGRPGDATRGTVVWCVLLGLPILAPMAMVDLELVLYVTVAVIAQLRRENVRFAGVLWGAALGCKYQAGMFFAAALVAQVLKRPARLAALVLPAAATMLPTMMRNWLQVGSPIAPFFVAWWPAGGKQHLMPFVVIRAQWWDTWRVTHAMTTLYHLATRTTIWDAMLSPMVVAIIPIVLIGNIRAIKKVYVAAAMVFWIVLAGYNGRYFLPLCPLIIVFALESLSRSSLDVFERAPVRLLFLGAICFEAALSLSWGYRIVNPNTVATGRESNETYLRRSLMPRPFLYDASVQVRGYLNPAVRYYLAGLDNGFYLGGLPYLESEDLPSPWSRFAAESATPWRMRVLVRQRGFRFLFVHEMSVTGSDGTFPAPGVWTVRSRRLCRDFLTHYTQRLYQGGDDGAHITFYRFLEVPGKTRSIHATLP